MSKKNEKLKIKATLLYNVVSLGSLGTELPACFMGDDWGREEEREKKHGEGKMGRIGTGKEEWEDRNEEGGNGKERNGKIKNRKRGGGEITLL